MYFNVIKNNKIIISFIFIIYNLISICFYNWGANNYLGDNFFSKISEFLYILNFLLIFLVLFFFRVKLFSPQGLFFISCCLFSLGRVFLSFFDFYRDYYELFWGQWFYLNNESFYRTLIFWQGSISSFIFGSVILSSRKNFDIKLIDNSYENTFKIMSLFSILILILIWFPVSYELLGTFLKAGYEGLYEGQTQYNFGYQRIAGLLLPIMFASSVLSNNKKILFFSLFTLCLYILVNLVVGQRALLFVWVLIGLWIYNLITKKQMPVLKISVFGILLMIFAQFLESFRGGRQDFALENPLSKFLYVQSLTFILPSIVDSIENEWPILVYVTMFLPVAGLFSSLGLVEGTKNFSSGSFFAYALNPTLFENGFGLGWSVFLDLYILGGKNYISLFIFSFILGIFYNSLIERAKNNIFFLFVLISSMPAFMFAPRSLMYSISSSIIYATLLLFMSYFVVKVFWRKR